MKIKIQYHSAGARLKNRNNFGKGCSLRHAHTVCYHSILFEKKKTPWLDVKNL